MDLILFKIHESNNHFIVLRFTNLKLRFVILNFECLRFTKPKLRFMNLRTTKGVKLRLRFMNLSLSFMNLRLRFMNLTTISLF